MSLHDLGFGHRFLVLTATTEKDKLAFLKLRIFHASKGITKKEKIQTTEWDKHLQIMYLMRV